MSEDQLTSNQSGAGTSGHSSGAGFCVGMTLSADPAPALVGHPDAMLIY
jgi:hypothetical protein